jgi:TonB family protein
MSDLDTLATKPNRALLADSGRRASQDPTQRKFMIGSLCLLLLALGIVLWHDRDFWFPDEPDADSDQPVESYPTTAKAAPVQPSAALAKRTKAATTKHHVESASATVNKTPAPPTPTEPPASTIKRTVLPPLEIEVIAGDSHRTIRPGSSSVRVDLEPGTPAQPVIDAPLSGDTEIAQKTTGTAPGHVQMSADAADIVARPVKPNYPLLARQMKVQGSVILRALIGRDGIIQNLQLVSGPRILASAAQDAVRQWHFKPHVEGSEAVETEAKITVNFTISTN